MRKLLIALVALASVLQLGLVAQPAFAQTLDTAGKYLGQTGLSGNTSDNPVTSDASANRLFAFIGNIINAAFGLLGILFVGLMLMAGYTWMMAQGDSKKVDTAKNEIKTAIIGLIILVLAYSITGFVMRAISQATQG